MHQNASLCITFRVRLLAKTAKLPIRRGISGTSTPAESCEIDAKTLKMINFERFDHPADWAHLIRMSATSGRLNSWGGRSPALSISRTFVPLGATLSPGPCGQVLELTTASHLLHQAVC